MPSFSIHNACLYWAYCYCYVDLYYIVPSLDTYYNPHLVLVGDTLRQQTVVREEAGPVQAGVVVAVSRLHRVRREQDRCLRRAVYLVWQDRVLYLNGDEALLLQL